MSSNSDQVQGEGKTRAEVSVLAERAFRTTVRNKEVLRGAGRFSQ